MKIGYNTGKQKTEGGFMKHTRLTVLNQGKPNHHNAVLYWMQSTQRVHDNAGLFAAIRYANKHEKTLTVVFNVVYDYPDANQRHYYFMLEGIEKVSQTLQSMGIVCIVTEGDFLTALKPLIDQAFAVFMDYPYGHYLSGIYRVITDYAKGLDLYCVQAESNVIVPVRIASQKSEYGARTLRPKLERLKNDYLWLEELPKINRKSNQANTPFNPSLEAYIKHLPIDHTIERSAYFTGGEDEAFKRLNQFIAHKLHHYLESNDPSLQLTSTLSPYLHFGQISPVRVYLTVQDACTLDQVNQAACDAFLEQLLVRRELGFNYMTFQVGYDQFETMTERWAYETMSIHEGDQRAYLYDIADYIDCKTHDIYFNAAMKEMVVTGFMHNYMRMYWAKKIIEWSPDYQTAYHNIVFLNNTYFLDGRDANSYASIAWCFGKHDRAWTERDIFGKLRYMNAAGLKRKFNIDAYVAYTNQLTL